MDSDRITRDDARPAGASPVEGHTEEEHVHLPPSSIWPISLALGISLAGLGVVTSMPVSIVGLILMFVSIISWVQELRHELH